MSDETIRISASQLSTFRECPRKWAYDKIDKIPRPETSATQAGTAIHAEIENFYLHGTVPESKAAQALLQHLPQPHDGIKSEADFFFPWFTPGVVMTGIVDLVDIKSATIYDHKTSSNVEKYSKSVEVLQADPQPILYGAYYRTAHNPKADIVNMQFTYVQRENPKTRPPHTKVVKFKQTLTDLETGLKILEPIVDEIVQIRRGVKHAKEVRFNQSACYNFGKCPYREACPDYIGHATPTATPKEVYMNPAFFALMKQAQTKANETPLPAPLDDQESTPPPVKPTPTPTSESAPLGQNSATLVVSEPPKMPLLDTLGIKFGITPEVLPPDAQPNVSENDPPPPPLVKGKGKKAAKAPVAGVESAPPGQVPVVLVSTIKSPSLPKSDAEVKQDVRDLLVGLLQDGSGVSIDQRLTAAGLLINLMK